MKQTFLHQYIHAHKIIVMNYWPWHVFEALLHPSFSCPLSGMIIALSLLVSCVPLRYVAVDDFAAKIFWKASATSPSYDSHWPSRPREFCGCQGSNWIWPSYTIIIVCVRDYRFVIRQYIIDAILPLVYKNILLSADGKIKQLF